MSGTIVRPAVVGEVERCAEVLGLAFVDYPWTRWTVDARDHVDRIMALQALALRHFGFPFGSAWVGLDDRDEIVCVAVWMDSAVRVPADVNDVVAAPTTELEGDRHDASVAAEAATSHWRPTGRHLYLATVGTLPEAQGRGVASAVLAPMLAIADGDGVDAFLETSSASNVSLYERLGFTVVDHVVLEGGGSVVAPDVWAMLRRSAVRPGRTSTASEPSAAG